MAIAALILGVVAALLAVIAVLAAIVAYAEAKQPNNLNVNVEQPEPMPPLEFDPGEQEPHGTVH